MKVGDKARPRGSALPFQAIDAEDEGMYLIKRRMGGSIFGRMWDNMAWYTQDELEEEQ